MLSGMCSPTTTVAARLEVTSDQLLPWGSPSGCWQPLGSRLCAQTAGTPLKPLPLDAHTDTEGAELPWPLGGTGDTDSAPKTRTSAWGSRAERKAYSTLSTIKTTELEVTLDAPAEQTESRAATCPQLLPALCPASTGQQEAQSQPRGPTASAAMGLQHLVHTGPALCSGWKQSSLWHL